MAHGPVSGEVLSLSDLVVGMVVTDDHDKVTVTHIEWESGNDVASVWLEPEFGEGWSEDVAREDWDEPMWEVA